MPNARAASAPCVLVCESPQTSVVPGSVKPCSGPITCTMPCCFDRKGKYARAPYSRMLASSVSTCSFDTGSLMPPAQSRVGVLWSAVDMIELMFQGLRPAIFSPSNACGLVTSCTRWRSM